MLSLVINTYNNDDDIADCIGSAAGLADEIVVCDMYSSDQTVAIAQSLGARVMYHPKGAVAEPARYAAISAAKGDWILCLDADERMTPKLASKIREAMTQNYDVIFIWSKNLYFGAYMEHGGFYYPIARCFRKQHYLATYNESETKPHNNFTQVAEQARSPLHLPKDYFYYHLAYPSIEKYVIKTLGYYPAIESQYDFEHGRRFSRLRMIYQPFKNFFVRYFLQQGYRDGTRGFIACALFAAYGFLKWANLWQLEEQTRKAKEPASLVDTPK